MTAAAEVTAPIAEGSIVVFRDIYLDGVDMEDVVRQLGHVAGHDRFLVLVVDTGSGDVETWGPDTDLADRIGTLLAEVQPPAPARPARPGSNAGWQGARRRPEPAPRRT